MFLPKSLSLVCGVSQDSWWPLEPLRPWWRGGEGLVGRRDGWLPRPPGQLEPGSSMWLGAWLRQPPTDSATRDNTLRQSSSPEELAACPTPVSCSGTWAPSKALSPGGRGRLAYAAMGSSDANMYFISEQHLCFCK